MICLIFRPRVVDDSTFCPTPKRSKMPRSETNPNAVLKEINDKFIRLHGQDVKESNTIIEKFIKDVLIKAMRKEDSLFNVLYSVSNRLGPILQITP